MWAVLAETNAVNGQFLPDFPARGANDNSSAKSTLANPPRRFEAALPSSLSFWDVASDSDRSAPATAAGGTPSSGSSSGADTDVYPLATWDIDSGTSPGAAASAAGGSPRTQGGGSAGPTSRRAAASAGGGAQTISGPPHGGADSSGDNFTLEAHYKYNGGGGYTSISSPQTDFSLNIQNQLTLDGTFADRNVPTNEQGFNIPFYRTYLFGNITKNIDYQGAVQGFLGSFNVLDLWVNARYDDRLNLRIGRMLSPFLFEYYGFSPAWEPVITNSMLFQIAGKRQEGAMLWGNLFKHKLQYQGGVYNGASGSYFGIGRNVSFLGSFTVTPFKGESEMFDSLGFGAGVYTGHVDYALNAGNNLNFINGAGEPTLNDNFITSTGVPWFQFANNVSANGSQVRFAPHFFWFGRFSILAEYEWYDRQLNNGTNSIVSVVQGWYVNASYFLTGERRTADGLGGYTTVTPLSSFRPTKGHWGLGAWEAAFQISQMRLGQSNFDPGFASSNNWANRTEQIMVGMNWWPNKYTRWSFDWMWNEFNRPIPLVNNVMASNLNTYWTRLAVFF